MNHPNRSLTRERLSPSKEEVRAARTRAGLTQTAAAALIHCSLKGWQEWEAGTRRMHPAMWELLRLKLTL